MKVYVFPGQGAQFEGMGKDLYEQSELARSMFAKADEIAGFSLSKIMFEGSAEELKQTKVTQPAMFLYAAIKVALLGEDFKPDAVAGHSLGELTALYANGTLTFEDAMRLVCIRANAVQAACDIAPGTMTAVLGADDEVVEISCTEATQGSDVVVAANYNCPGQLVISGTMNAIGRANEILAAKGAKLIPLQVGGAFHSPLMEPARAELAAAIEKTTFSTPKCPIYQNVDAMPHTEAETIKANLVSQLTAPVRWTQSVRQMLSDGATSFAEVGGKVLQGMIKKIDRQSPTETV